MSVLLALLNGTLYLAARRLCSELAQEVLQPLQDEDSSFSMIVRDAGRFQRMKFL